MSNSIQLPADMSESREMRVYRQIQPAIKPTEKLSDSEVASLVGYLLADLKIRSQHAK